MTVAAQHLRSLGEYPFDSVLLPYNYPMSRNTAYMEDFEALVEVCEQRGVAIQTIKAITRAPWGERQQTANTWYEPLTDQSAIDLAVSWVLGRAGFFLNTVGDIHVLPKVLEAAERFSERLGRGDGRAEQSLRPGAAFRLTPTAAPSRREGTTLLQDKGLWIEGIEGTTPSSEMRACTKADGPRLMNPGAVFSQLLSWSVAASPMRSAVGPAVADVGVDLFLADLFGNLLLIRDRLSTETNPLDRNRFLLHNGPLLAEDHLMLLLADVRT